MINYLDNYLTGPSSNHLKRKKWFRLPANILRTKPNCLPASQTIEIKTRQRKAKVPPGTCPYFNWCESFTEHTPPPEVRVPGQVPSLWLCHCADSSNDCHFFSSPTASCSRSSPACVLKPRVHSKPCNISCNRNAISEAHSCWAPPLHAPSPQRRQSPRQVQGAPGQAAGLRLPLHFVISAASTGLLLLSTAQGWVQCDAFPSAGAEAPWSSYFQVNSWEKQDTTNFSRLCVLANEALKGMHLHEAIHQANSRDNQLSEYLLSLVHWSSHFLSDDLYWSQLQALSWVYFRLPVTTPNTHVGGAGGVKYAPH